jgi:mannose-6-phosphate isomerase-like protein (cupin superfamily)
VRMGLLFERDITPTTNIAAGFVRIPAGQEQPRLSVHAGEEIYLVVRGRARFHLGPEVVEIGPETAVYVASGTPHRAENAGTEELLLYWVNSPPVFGPIGAYKEQMAEWTQVSPLSAETDAE